MIKTKKKANKYAKQIYLRIREAYLTFRERYVFFLPPNFLEKMQKINNMTLQFLTGNCGKM
jgi:hypothetical protein